MAGYVKSGPSRKANGETKVEKGEEMKMKHTEKYLKSFGILTEEQVKIVKNTLGYQTCLLADSIRIFKQQFYKILFKWTR